MFTQELLNQCHSEALAEESHNFMRYFANAQYDHVLTKFSVNKHVVYYLNKKKVWNLYI